MAGLPDLWDLVEEARESLKLPSHPAISRRCFRSDRKGKSSKERSQTTTREPNHRRVQPPLTAMTEIKDESCIKWVQDSFPTGGDCSGLVVIYEQCVRNFCHDERYKDDQRYLKVWLEYAENCVDADVIFQFLQANQIGQSYSAFYAAYALHMEFKKKLQAADEIFYLGTARKAKPVDPSLDYR